MIPEKSIVHAEERMAAVEETPAADVLSLRLSLPQMLDLALGTPEVKIHPPRATARISNFGRFPGRRGQLEHPP